MVSSPIVRRCSKVWTTTPGLPSLGSNFNRTKLTVKSATDSRYGPLWQKAAAVAYRLNQKLVLTRTSLARGRLVEKIEASEYRPIFRPLGGAKSQRRKDDCFGHWVDDERHAEDLSETVQGHSFKAAQIVESSDHPRSEIPPLPRSRHSSSRPQGKIIVVHWSISRDFFLKSP